MLRKILAITVFFITIGVSAPVNIVPYASTGANMVTFEDVAGTPFPGTTYGTLVSGGVSFGERFAGQILSLNGTLDVLDETATGPLSVVAGAPGQSLSIGTDSGDNELYPYGPLGFPDPEGYGEGSWAALFPGDISSVGFLSNFGGSEVFVSFFRGDGSLISTVSAPGGTAVGFAREGGVRDIRGISVYTNDGGGLSYDDVRFDSTAVVPEPGSMLLMGAGLGLLVAVRVRTRQ